VSGRTFVIAEAGVNHNGRLEVGLELVDAAAAAGADAVKFQTFRAADLATSAAPKADYQTRTTGVESQREMLARLELSEADHRALRARSIERGIEFMSSPFDIVSLELLVRLGVRRLKIGSGELTNGPLLLAAGRSGLPVILSTGMAALDEIEAALGVLAFAMTGPPSDTTPEERSFQDAYAAPSGRTALADRVSILHCTTEYPAPVDEVNLLAIPVLAESFGLPVGYSDHTAGSAVAVAAVAIGAVIIEKHLTLDRSLPGPDHLASIEPDAFARMVAEIREVEQALGARRKAPGATELRNAPIARKSLVAATAIRAGSAFTAENLAVKRPGTGRSPMDYWALLGTQANRDYATDELIDP
jgi:2,4-diacetamido-2,4,6-trideoxy-beta-L-gulose transferase